MKLFLYLLSCMLAGLFAVDLHAQNRSAATRHEALKGTSTASLSLDAVSGNALPCVDGTAGDFACSNVDLLAFLPIDQIGGRRFDNKLLTSLNDVWGWTDPETNHEYALVGRTDGTSFVDITDPENPVYLGSLPSTDSTQSVWRDIKVIDHYALIVADAIRHGLQIFDLHGLRDVGAAPVEFSARVDSSMLLSAHNIVANDETNFAYAVGSAGAGACPGLLMIDLENPEDPREAGCYVDIRVGFTRPGYTHDAQCVIYHGPDDEYVDREICFGANETAVQITDVTDKQNPTTISVAEYPNFAYTHQGWLTPDHRYFFQDDELDEVYAAFGPAGSELPGTRTLIWDLEVLDEPQFVGAYFGKASSIDHNMYIVGDLAFQANYTSGLRILDVSNPAAPEEVGFFDTYPLTDSAVVDSIRQFAGAWSNYPFFESGVVVVSSIGEGLFVLRPTGGASTDAPAAEIPDAFRLLATYPNPFSRATTIRLQLDRPQRLRIAVFDMQGKEVRQVYSGFIESPGTYEYPLDAAGLASGTYAIRAIGESSTQSTTVTLVR